MLHHQVKFGKKLKKLIPKVPPRSDNDVEIISTNKKCRKAIKFANAGYKECDWQCDGRDTEDPNFATYIFNDADVFGHTAQFTNEAIIYCGGKAKKGNLAECWEYDNIRNE